MTSTGFLAMVEEAGDLTPIPNGDYNFVIISAKGGTSKNGKPQIMTTVQVEEGQPAAGKTNIMGFNLSEGSERMFFLNLQGVGIDQATLRTMALSPDPVQSMVVIAQYLPGRRFQGTVKKNGAYVNVNPVAFLGMGSATPGGPPLTAPGPVAPAAQPVAQAPSFPPPGMTPPPPTAAPAPVATPQPVAPPPPVPAPVAAPAPVPAPAQPPAQPVAVPPPLPPSAPLPPPAVATAAAGAPGDDEPPF